MFGGQMSRSHQMVNNHRVIMYFIETKAIGCHTKFGQFLGSYQTLGEEEVGIFVDSILQF
jgi:hypothetical protein